MIERDFKKYLKKLASTEFRDNRLAQVLAIHWGRKEISTEPEPRKLFGSLIPLVSSYLNYSREPHQRIEGEQPTEEYRTESAIKERDFRISSIILSSLRGIGDKINDIPYGIDLTNHSQTPYNAIIVGNNGSGKTSIFSALEYIYVNEIDEAKLRKFGSDRKPNFHEYLKRADGSYDPFCEINTVLNETYNIKKRIIDIDNFKEIANPQTSFISEYDTFEYGQKDLSGEDDFFHNRVAEWLGFKDYVDFNEYLDALNRKKSIREIKGHKDNLESQEEKRTEIESWKKEIHNLEKQLVDISSSDTEEIYNTMVETIKRRQSEVFDEIPMGKLAEKFRSLSELFSDYNSIESEMLDEEKIQFLQLGLQLIDKEKDCPFCKNSNSKIEKMKSDVETRLSGAEKYLSINKALSETYEGLLLDLNGFVLILAKYKRIIEDDLREFSTISGLDDLSKTGREVLGDTKFEDLNELRQEIEDFENKSSFDNLARENLIRFLNERSDFFFNNSLVTHLMDFKAERDRKIEQTLLDLKKEYGVQDGKTDKAVIDFRISELKRKVETTKKSIDDLKANEDTLREEVEAYELIKSEVPPLLARVEEDILEILESAIKPLRETVIKTFDVFLEKDELNIEIDLKEISDPKSEIVKKRLFIDLVNNEKGLRTTPKEYFNAFRYKIFCGTLAIGVAIASRKNSGINLPFILDDEFFASDIINRSEFESYFKNIILMYRAMTPHLPFQFIMFTHDELIFESAKEAVENVWTEIQKLNEQANEETERELSDYWKSPLDQKTKYARLFPSSQKENLPRKIKSGKEYWNLLHEFET